jgi:hypothetical protein
MRGGARCGTKDLLVAFLPAKPSRRGDRADRAGDPEAVMRIVRIEDLHCDTGWRVRSFFKMSGEEKRTAKCGMAGGAGDATELFRG